MPHDKDVSKMLQSVTTPGGKPLAKYLNMVNILSCTRWRSQMPCCLYPPQVVPVGSSSNSISSCCSSYIIIMTNDRCFSARRRECIPWQPQHAQWRVQTVPHTLLLLLNYDHHHPHTTTPSHRNNTSNSVSPNRQGQLEITSQYPRCDNSGSDAKINYRRKSCGYDDNRN